MPNKRRMINEIQYNKYLLIVKTPLSYRPSTVVIYFVSAALLREHLPTANVANLNFPKERPARGFRTDEKCLTVCRMYLFLFFATPDAYVNKFPAITIRINYIFIGDYLMIIYCVCFVKRVLRHLFA